MIDEGVGACIVIVKAVYLAGDKQTAGEAAHKHDEAGVRKVLYNQDRNKTQSAIGSILIA